MIAPFDPNLTRVQLRQEIMRHLTLKGWKRKDLARVSDIEAVTISNLLNNKQRFMLYQLDAITQALDLPAGHFYSYFKAECCNHEGRIRPKKCGEFVVRCLEVGKQEEADEFVDAILEEKDRSRRSSLLLDIAETIFHSPFRQEALPYYEQVIRSEQRLSPPLAVSYYRRFLLTRESEQGYGEKLHEVFHQFIDHVHRLPTLYRDYAASEEGSVINLQFQAYCSILLYYKIAEQWRRLLPFATTLEQLATEAGDDNYLGEALRYQVMAYRGQGKRRWRS